MASAAPVLVGPGPRASAARPRPLRATPFAARGAFGALAGGPRADLVSGSGGSVSRTPPTGPGECVSQRWIPVLRRPRLTLANLEALLVFSTLLTPVSLPPDREFGPSESPADELGSACEERELDL